MKNRKERIIYNNYDLWDYRDDAVEILAENDIENPTDDDIRDELYFMDSTNWEDAEIQMREFFGKPGHAYILQGYVGTWHGNMGGGFVFHDFKDLWYTHNITKDCDYVKIYDVDGHFYIECSHHDGTNFYEVKELTDKGMDYFQNWEENYSDRRTMREVHTRLMTDSHYSHLPDFAHKVYGCPRKEAA